MYEFVMIKENVKRIAELEAKTIILKKDLHECKEELCEYCKMHISPSEKTCTNCRWNKV